MRGARDRFRHAALFEMIALALVIPAGSFLFGVSSVEFGVVAVVSTTVAMVWNFVFNLAFDHAMERSFGTVRKTIAIRVVHTLAFEAGLTCLLVPFIAWFLGVTLWQAFLLDVSLIGFYAVYAFLFNWAYDVAFPSVSLGRDTTSSAENIKLTKG